MSEECGACKFWMKRSDELGNRGGGYCRRYPPAFPSETETRVTEQFMSGRQVKWATTPGTMFNDAWPNTHQQSWCGEFSPSPPPNPTSIEDVTDGQ